MTVNAVTAAWVVVCFAASVGWVGAYDVTIINATRQVKDDWSEMTVTVDFTAASPPETAWFYADRHGNEVIVADHNMEFADGQGRVTVTLGYMKRVTLKIGHFDSHFLQVSFVRKLFEFDDNLTQVLGTSSSVLSSGYDIAYTAAGESFDVTATVPRHIAPGYSFSTYYDGSISAPRVDSCYVDQHTHQIVSEVDHIDRPDTSAFLNVVEEPGETDTTVKMTFDTSDVDISGYFEIFTMYDIDDKESPSLVDDIRETIFLSVHNATTPGPFPAGYGAIRTDKNERCSPDKLCLLYCYGFSNQIDRVAIIRNQDGAELDAKVRYTNSHHVVFHLRLDTSESFAGSYSCRMELPGGVVVEENIAVVEVDDLYRY